MFWIAQEGEWKNPADPADRVHVHERDTKQQGKSEKLLNKIIIYIYNYIYIYIHSISLPFSSYTTTLAQSVTVLVLTVAEVVLTNEMLTSHPNHITITIIIPIGKMNWNWKLWKLTISQHTVQWMSGFSSARCQQACPPQTAACHRCKGYPLHLSWEGQCQRWSCQLEAQTPTSIRELNR
jgi:hypothetical protein